MELEGSEHVVTTARDDLMRLYLKTKRYDAAMRLGEELVQENSVWIRFSVAWVAVELQKDVVAQHDILIRAIRANPFCAYFLAFFDTFTSVMEYTEELEDAQDVAESSFEEALEYCTAEVAKCWQENGAALVLRNLLLGALQGTGSDMLSRKDVEWEERLAKIEKEFDARTASSVDESFVDADPHGEGEKEEVDSFHKSSDEDHPHPDLKMFAGMFRTAMEMLEESGELRMLPQVMKEPSEAVTLV
jgi:lipopolysaccharide biosynthesis regulator YciM